MHLGKRIVVAGVSASGKSVLARRLSAVLRTELIHTDEVMWRSGWEYVGDEETVAALEEASRKEAWIIEGFIAKGAFESVLTRADSIIYLDYPRHIPALRYIKRWRTHRRDPRPELPGCPEKFSISFLRRIWDKKEVYRLNTFIEQRGLSGKVIRLGSPKEAETLLLSVGH